MTKTKKATKTKTKTAAPKRTKKAEPKKDEPALPKGILKTDLRSPWSYRDYGPRYDKRMASYARENGETYGQIVQFEIWYTARFGWCIPCLLIRKARGGSGSTDRYYAISVDGEMVRIGRGPHVLRTETVYVKKSRLSKLQQFLDLKAKGEVNANDTRDRISTRRARSRRGGYGWLY